MIARYEPQLSRSAGIARSVSGRIRVFDPVNMLGYSFAMTATIDNPRFSLLYDLGCAFAARIELDQLLPFIVEKSREVLDAEGVSLLFLDNDRREFYFPYVSENDPEIARRLTGLRFPADRGIAGEVLSSGRQVRVDDAQSDPRLYHGIDQVTGIITRNMLVSPLMTRQGAVGVIEVVNARGKPSFADDDALFLGALSGSIAVAIENARLYARVRESEASLRTQVGALRRDLTRQERSLEMIGASPAMDEVRRLMDTAAASSITVMIEGETGTGKELVARGIHRASARADNPFIAINCAAMPETLLESELFGHRRGAFTGAVRDNPGLFRAASGGTIFLDEVGDMPLAMQAKLLRVLEAEEVVPLGGSQPAKVDVRVLSATNRDLRKAVADGNFRQDLFYRLAVFPIRLPSLRERRDDIPMLAGSFLNEANVRYQRHSVGFEPDALNLLIRYDWPGNIRELRNEIERTVAIVRDNEMIGPEQLSPQVRMAAAAAADSAPTIAPALTPRTGADIDVRSPLAPGQDEPRPAITPLREARAAFEARYIAEVLRHHKGNVSRASTALGLSRVSLQKKVKEYGLRRSDD